MVVSLGAVVELLIAAILQHGYLVTVRELARTAGSVFRCGNRVLVDVKKFDRWCDEHSEA